LSIKAKESNKTKGVSTEKDLLDETHIEENKNTEFDDESESKLSHEDLKKLIKDKNAKLMHPLEVRQHVKTLWENEKMMMDLLFGKIEVKNNYDNNYQYVVESTGPDLFFLDTIIVPPNRFRPENNISGFVYLHHHTAMLTKIMNLNNHLRSLIFKEEKSKKKEVKDNLLAQNSNLKEVINTWVEIQEAVNVMYDSAKSSNTVEKKERGIRQLLEQKEGLFRMKMMGKRVNYAGRSVISPDPFINANEVGIPLVIATKLTFPEYVNCRNIDYLKKLILNGPKKYPGATFVEDEKGTSYSLTNISEKAKKYLLDNLDKGKKIVYRHLMNSDYLLVNRQPTLHKPSIMGHKVRILPREKTIRLHYANCNSYNADFDGDEINVHLLQNLIAKEESRNIANTDNQYLVPTSGKPIRGLIQDSIVSAIFLTIKDCFFQREFYQQIVYLALESSLNSKSISSIEFVHPAIIKPKMLWTGKQVITTIIKSLANSHKYNKVFEGKGLNMDQKGRIYASIWGNPHEMETILSIRDNEILTGVLDKNQIGNSEFGLIHSYFELYGPKFAGELISVFGRLFIHYLQFFHGFTCGVSDLILKDEFNFKRRYEIENILMSGMKSLSSFMGLKDYDLTIDNFSNRFVYSQKNIIELISQSKVLNKNEKANLIEIENNKQKQSLFSDNISKDNSKFISELSEKFKESILNNNEQNLDIVVKSTVNKQLFKLNESIIPKGCVKQWPNNYFYMMVLSGAKGTMVNQFQCSSMLGQQELEGRRVPRMASGKTLPSFEPFDPNPRAGGFVSDNFTTGVRPQEFFFHCMAGREGLIDTAVKTSRSGYLQRCLIKHLEQLIVNYDYTVRDQDGNLIQFLYGEDSIEVTKAKFLSNFKFICQNNENTFKKHNPQKILEKIDTKTIFNYTKEKKFYEDNDTLLNKFQPWNYLGSISEKIHSEMIKFINSDTNKYFSSKSVNKVKFKNNIYLKYLTSLISPGESVGVIAAQSIGILRLLR
jgi:DNA-directed RNA polymerase I subunit RPA1